MLEKIKDSTAHTGSKTVFRYLGNLLKFGLCGKRTTISHQEIFFSESVWVLAETL
jgi:hypothetical protein